MAYSVSVDAATLSRFGTMHHPLYLGVAFLVIIEAMVSSTLIASYFYLAVKSDAWPPAGVAPPPALWPGISTALLLASALTMRLAGQAIDKGNPRGLTLGVGASTLLATLVLVIRGFQFGELDFRWDEHAYGSAVWTITGFHFVHVASAALGTGLVTVLAWKGYFTQRRQVGVVVDTLYWYFVAFVWLPFYVTVYLSPHVL